MKKSIKIIFGLCVASLLMLSCKSTTKAVTNQENVVKEEKLTNSLLWKITGNGIEKPSYLYGTIHLTCNYELNDKMKTAFAETDRVVLEIDMDDPEMQMKAMKSMMMKDGKTIKSILTEDEYKKLGSYVKENTGMNLDMLNTMKPFTILSLLVSKSVDCEAPTGYDMEFVKIAKEQNEEVLGLETLESQMAIFDGIPYKEQLDDLLKMADDGMDKGKEEFAKLSNFHSSEDIEGMLKMANETEGMTKEFSDVLLDGRNKNWIPIIGKMAKETPTFFGVGALHLAGDNGVIKLLKKEGYVVTPVLN